MVCLDTSFVIDFFRGRSNAVEQASTLAANNETITITAPTLMELATGAALNQSRAEKVKLTDFLNSVTVLPLNKKAALLAGELNAGLITGGEMIEPMDIQIGAIAVAHNEQLITKNVRHFSRIPGLEVRTY